MGSEERAEAAGTRSSPRGRIARLLDDRSEDFGKYIQDWLRAVRDLPKDGSTRKAREALGRLRRFTADLAEKITAVEGGGDAKGDVLKAFRRLDEGFLNMDGALSTSSWTKATFRAQKGLAATEGGLRDLERARERL